MFLSCHDYVINSLTCNQSCYYIYLQKNLVLYLRHSKRKDKNSNQREEKGRKRNREMFSLINDLRHNNNPLAAEASEKDNVILQGESTNTNCGERAREK